MSDELRPLDERGFGDRVEPHRRERHVQCYRLLGSFEEAEDLVQASFLRGCDSAMRRPASGRRRFVLVQPLVPRVVRQPLVQHVVDGDRAQQVVLVVGAR